MSVLILIICSTFFEKLIIIQCAPKIGNFRFDPLIYEANNFIKIVQDSPESSDGYLTNDRVPYLRNSDDVTSETKKKCEGYDFDENKCAQVNGRLLCGYNKNLGQINTEDQIVDLGNGCQQRGDRIECGYVNGPFNLNTRRPPSSYPQKEDVTHNIGLRDTSNLIEQSENPTRNKPALENKENINFITEKTEESRTIVPDSTKSLPTEKLSKHVTVKSGAESTKLISKAVQTTYSEGTLKTFKNIENIEGVIRNSSFEPKINATVAKNTILKVVTTNSSPIPNYSKTTLTYVPTPLYNVPKMETIREILRLRDALFKPNIIENINSTNTVSNSSEPKLKTYNKTISKVKTVCVEKNDRIFCYDLL